MPYKDKVKQLEAMREINRKHRLNKVKSAEQRLAELEFKLKALSNFVFEHHHNWRWATGEYFPTTKGKVWVEYPDGMKEEGKPEGVEKK